MKRAGERKELIRRAQAGDQEALQELVLAVLPTVTALVRGGAPWVDSVEDAVQEVVLRVLVHLRSLRDPGKFGRYVNQVTRNYLRDLLRRRRSAVPLTESVEAPGSDPFTEAAHREEAAQVHRAIAQLSELDRQVVLLRHWAGARYEEIAEVLGLSVSAVQSRLFRARRELARLLRQYGPEGGRHGGTENPSGRSLKA